MIYYDANDLRILHNADRYIVGEAKQRHQELDYIYSDTLVGWFDGVDTFLRFLEDKMPKAKRSKASEDTGSFYHFKTYKKALDTYLNRPHEVLQFEEIDEPIREHDESGNNVGYGMEGDFIDIGRFLTGEPEVFGTMQDGNPKRYRVDLTLNMSWSGSTDKETIQERLKHVVATVDWLEMNGVRTRITAIESTQVAHIEIVVKDFSETLDLRQLAVVSHSDFLRRAFFRFDEYSESFESGYGRANLYSDAIKSQIMKNKEVSNEIPVFIDSRYTNENGYANEFASLRKKILESFDSPKHVMVLG
jgi:hypothetical protein